VAAPSSNASASTPSGSYFGIVLDTRALSFDNASPDAADTNKDGSLNSIVVDSLPEVPLETASGSTNSIWIAIYCGDHSVRTSPPTLLSYSPKLISIKSLLTSKFSNLIDAPSLSSSRSRRLSNLNGTNISWLNFIEI
jgi:hypothetical protein